MEWTVVTVIVVLVGLVAAITRPLINLNTTIAKLDTTLCLFRKEYDGDKQSNHEAHIALWDKCNEHEDKIGDHETRIAVIESKGA